MDDGSERIQAKVKVAANMKVPYLAVVGPRDAENREVSIRAFGVDQNLGSMGLEEFLETVSAESRTRGETRLIDRFETADPNGRHDPRRRCLRLAEIRSGQNPDPAPVPMSGIGSRPGTLAFGSRFRLDRPIRDRCNCPRSEIPTVGTPSRR